jgi:hypothetical protein
MQGMNLQHSNRANSKTTLQQLKVCGRTVSSTELAGATPKEPPKEKGKKRNLKHREHLSPSAVQQVRQN